MRFSKLVLIRAMPIVTGTLVFLFFPIVLPIADYGRLVFYWTSSITMAGLTSLGFNNYILREGVSSSGLQTGIYSVQEFLYFVLAYPLILLFGFAAILASSKRFLEVDFHFPACLFVISYSMNLLKIVSVLYRVQGRDLISTIIGETIAPLLLFFTVGLLIVMERINIELMFNYFTVVLVFFALSVSILTFYYNQHFFKPRMLSKNNVYNISFAYNSVLQSLSAGADIFALKVLSGDVFVGLYQLAKKIGSFVALPQQITNWLVAVKPVRLIKNSRLADANELISVAISKTLFLSIGLFFIASGMALFYYHFRVDFSLEIFLFIFFIFAFNSIVVVLSGANFIIASQLGFEFRVFLYRLLLLFIPVLAYIMLWFFDGISNVILCFIIALVNCMTSVFVQIHLSYFIHTATGVVPAVYIKN